MNEPHNDNSNDTIDSSSLEQEDEQEGAKTVLRKVGAAAVTFIILYMLLGIPAYLLFRVFFSE